MVEENKEKGFVIKDRRLFTEAGEVRGNEETSDRKIDEKKEEQKPEPERAEATKETADEAGSREKPAKEEKLPEMNFSNFVLSLSTSVMYHFGDFPDPATKKAERNLDAAKQTIDILGMLHDKTKGNLESGEKNLLDAVLFELRMRFVKEKDKG